jgi:hypothetical protein
MRHADNRSNPLDETPECRSDWQCRARSVDIDDGRTEQIRIRYHAAQAGEGEGIIARLRARRLCDDSRKILGARWPKTI